MRKASGKILRPRWDAGRTELFWGAKRIGEYDRDAPDQIKVLELLEKFGWPPRADIRSLIPDGVNAKAWVKYTVENLNRKINKVIRFHGNAANRTIGWSL